MTREERAAKHDQQLARHRNRGELSWDRIARERRDLQAFVTVVEEKIDELAPQSAAVVSAQLATFGMLGLVLDALKLVNDNTRDRETIRDNTYRELLLAIKKNTAGAAWMSESSS